MFQKNNSDNDTTMEQATQEILSNRARKKEDKIIRTWEEPVLPPLCRILFIGMIAITIAMLLVDCKNFFSYHLDGGAFTLLSNLATTGFFSVLMFSVLLVPLSALGRHQNTKQFWERKKKDGYVPSDQEAKARNERALARLNATYRRYQMVCLAACLVFGLFFVISYILK